MGNNDDDARSQNIDEGNDSNTDKHDSSDVGNNTKHQPSAAVPPRAPHPLDTVSETAFTNPKLTTCYQDAEDSILCDML
jgi:hypothetical protein